MPASGGAGAIAVRTERECQWTAQPDANWLTVTAGKSGQGDGTVQFGAAANPDPVPRSGGIMLNGERAAVTQAAADCRFELGSTFAAFSPEGGTGSVEVRASSPLCTWTATSNAEWISIAGNATGRGTATLTFGVAATTGPARTGTLTIAGLAFKVEQTQQPCTFSVSPLTYATGSAGGSQPITVTARAECSWAAASNAPWISLSTSSGAGSGSVTVTVAPTTGPPRTGTVTIGGQVVTVTQSAGCSFEVAPLSHTVPSSGGTVSVNVATAQGCAWSASSDTPWLVITSPASGSGSGAVTVTAASTNGPSRSGTFTVAGQTVTVVQGQGCTYAIAPDSQNVPAAGGNVTVSVTAAEGCGWSAASNVSWVKVTSAASGSGNGSVTFTVEATNGPARSGTLAIAGRTFTVNQGQGCTFSLSSPSASVPAAGGSGSFEVRAANGCGWSASSNATWLAVTEGVSGNGNGTVRYSVAANTGPARTATITAGGQTFTVTQGVGCSYSVSPTAHGISKDGGTASVSIAAAPGCSWTARSNAGWIGISSDTSGSGDGSVQFVVAANSGADRQGTLTIAGQTVTITQAGGCTYAISPASQAVPAEGGPGSFAVTTAATCPWKAETTTPWIALGASASGTGSGPVQFTAAANTSGGSRTGTILVAGQTFTVTQPPSCTAVVAPDTIAAPAAAGGQTIGVTIPAECGVWMATSQASWIEVVPPGTGTGDGSVQLNIHANTTPARSGTATVAGRTVTVNQESGCAVTIAPAAQPMPAGGGPGSVTVTAGAGCPWNVTSNSPWIIVAGDPNRVGDGTVQFTVDANATGAARTGTITIGGQVFTVNQAGSEEF